MPIRPEVTDRRARRTLVGLVAGVMTLDAAIYAIGIPVVPLHLTRLGLDIGETGLVFATFAGSQLLTFLWALLYGARIRPDRLLWAGLAGVAASPAIFALSAEWIPGLVAGRMLHGVAGALCWVAGPALLSEVFPDETRGAALGSVLGITALGSLLGPPLGGALYDWGGFVTPYALATGLAVAAVVAVTLTARRSPTPITSDPPRPVAGGIRRLIGDRRVSAPLIAVACSAAALGLLEPLLPVVLHQTLGTTGWQSGAIFGVAVLCYGLCAPVAGRLSDQLGRLPIIASGLALLAVAFAALAAVDGPVAITAVACLIGVALGLGLTPTMPAMAELAERGVDGSTAYASVYALHSLIYAGGHFVGPSLGGQGVERFGLPATLVAAAVVLAVAVAVAWALGRRAAGGHGDG